MTKVDESAGIPRGFGIDPVPQQFKNPTKEPEVEEPEPDPMIPGTKYLSLMADPREVVLLDTRKGIATFSAVHDPSFHGEMPLAKFIRLYQRMDTLEEKSYRAGDIGAYIDPEHGDQGQVEDLMPMVIDLGSSRRGDLDESFLRMFGSGIQAIMRRMFGGPIVPVTVRGTRSEIKSFANVLQKEKRYLQTWQEMGLDDPATYKSKYKLDTAVRQFERKTGIKYPFK